MGSSHDVALASREDLKTFNRNARLLFALETRFRIDDIATVAANALTDGHDDKKCDLVYIDRESGLAVVAQAYESDKHREAAKANKAADLNTAIAWLLTSPLTELPDGLRSAATELRSALTDNELRVIQVWFVHNLPESDNVENELRTVERSLETAVKRHFPTTDVEEFRAIEVGASTLEEWYQALEAPILVTEEIQVAVPGSYELHGDNWSAAVTSVPAAWLHNLWKKHQSKLFSANVRDYLGSRRSIRNVNHNIKKTASESPPRFWAYNNGVTALVNRYQLDAGRLTIEGISIVNGAQTTGALGSLSSAPDSSAMVQARFVRCTDSDTIRKIIQFNNTQNVVEVTDFRSNDGVQRRLRDEFKQIPNAIYLGGRRGGDDDFIRRSANLLPTDTCSQALACFHGEPNLAYNKKSEIWEKDVLYSRFFSDDTNARHVVLAYSLLRSVEHKKRTLVDKTSHTAQEKKQLEFLRCRGATFLLCAAVAACMETFLDHPVANRFRLSFGKVSPPTAMSYWSPIVDAVAPFCSSLQDGVDAIKNRDAVSKAIGNFQDMVEATRAGNSHLFTTFASNVIDS